MLQKKQKDDKKSAKASEALVEKKKAENKLLRASGVAIDPNLGKQDIERFALKIVKRIMAIVSVDNKCYAFVCRDYRVLTEAFASLSSRGKGTRLI